MFRKHQEVRVRSKVCVSVRERERGRERERERERERGNEVSREQGATSGKDFEFYFK